MNNAKQNAMKNTPIGLCDFLMRISTFHTICGYAPGQIATVGNFYKIDRILSATGIEIVQKSAKIRIFANIY